MKLHRYSLFILVLMMCAAPLRISWADSEACLECHGESELKAVTEKGSGLKLHTSEHQFERSVHGKLECVTCHAPMATDEDFEDVPHNIKPEALPSCMNCHENSFGHVKEQIAQSAHFEKQGNDIGCTDCHNPHTQKSVTAMDSYAASVDDSNKVCMDCHTSAIRYKELTGREVYSQDLSHEFLPNRDQHFASVRCVECHTPYDGNAQEHIILSKDQALHECESCHTEDNSLLVARIQKHTDIQQGGGSFLGKGFFDDAELIDKMKKAGVTPDGTEPIVTRIVPEEEIIRGFEDTYVPGLGQDSALESKANILLALILAAFMIHGLLRVFLVQKPEGEDVRGEKIYPTVVRVLHLTNAVLFLTLLATGFSIHFPDAALSLPMEFSNGVHNIAGILLVINFALFLLFSLLSGDIVQYLPFKSGGMQAFKQQLHYYVIGIFRGDKKPHHASAKQRMNPVQQLTYLVVYCLGMFVMLASGMLLLVPELAAEYLPEVSNRSLANAHFILAIGYLAFLLVHLYMLTTGKRPLSLLKGMATGHHYE